MHKSLKILGRRKSNILVLGDVMLDKYYFGSVDRISPEAPIPVFHYESERCSLGGAANVAVNLAAMGENVALMSIIGDDADGKVLMSLLDSQCINSNLMLCDPRYCTTVKTRMLAQNNQQLIRMDVELVKEIENDTEDNLINLLERNIKDFDIILISDYLKGLLKESFIKKAISIAKILGKKVLIDIKDKNVHKYEDAYLLKPNKKELAEIMGVKLEDKEDIVNAAMMLKLRTNVQCVLVTIGPGGMLLIDEENHIHSIESQAKQVYDVTGAGDTVMSYLGACISKGIDCIDAVKLSNIAAGIKVGKVGTAVVALDEVIDYINKNMGFKEKKLITIDDLKELDQIRKGKKLVFTNGCFDILHSGHIRYLNKAKSMGDILIVAVNSDESVKTYKGKGRPILSQDERIEILEALECVDFVVMFEEDTPFELIKLIKPDVLVKGGDYQPYQVVGRDIVESYGGKLEITEFVHKKSTSNIVRKIIESYEQNILEI